MFISTQTPTNALNLLTLTKVITDKNKFLQIKMGAYK